MARARKKHIQQAFEFRSHGGKRKGAGRPPKGKRSSEPHKEREEIDPRHPLHVVTRVVDGLGSLRKRDFYRAICDATVTAFRHGAAKVASAGRSHVADFRIVQASIQRNHVHLLVEAANKEALAEGVQVLLSAAARFINRAVRGRTGQRRRGQVFADRYYALPLTTPRQVRNCLSYVLNNWRKHGEDRDRRWNVDPFSTGIWFPGWSERAAAPLLYQPPQGYEWMMTWLPKTWLLREGWKKHPLVSLREVPGPLDDPRRRLRA
jgi:putative transposase